MMSSQADKLKSCEPLWADVGFCFFWSPFLLYDIINLFSYMKTSCNTTHTKVLIHSEHIKFLGRASAMYVFSNAQLHTCYIGWNTGYTL